MRYLPYYRDVVSQLCNFYNSYVGISYGVELLTDNEYKSKYKKDVNIENCGGFFEPRSKIIVMFYEHIARKKRPVYV